MSQDYVEGLSVTGTTTYDLQALDFGIVYQTGGEYGSAYFQSLYNITNTQ
jgi:hypothetical protein